MMTVIFLYMETFLFSRSVPWKPMPYFRLDCELSTMLKWLHFVNNQLCYFFVPALCEDLSESVWFIYCYVNKPTQILVA